MCADCKVSFIFFLFLFFFSCCVRPGKSCSVIARIRGLNKISFQYHRPRAIAAVRVDPLGPSASPTHRHSPWCEHGKATRNSRQTSFVLVLLGIKFVSLCQGWEYFYLVEALASLNPCKVLLPSCDRRRIPGLPPGHQSVGGGGGGGAPNTRSQRRLVHVHGWCYKVSNSSESASAEPERQSADGPSHGHAEWTVPWPRGDKTGSAVHPVYASGHSRQAGVHICAVQGT